MRMSLTPPPQREGYASYLAAMQMLEGPGTRNSRPSGTNRTSFPHLSSSSLWTIWMRKTMRTTTMTRISKMRKMKTI